MVREAICVGVGRDGISQACHYFRVLQKERKLEDDGKCLQSQSHGINCYWNEIHTNEFQPRLVLIDFETHAREKFRAFPVVQNGISDENTIYEANTPTSWTDGYECDTLAVRAVESMRQQLEVCDHPEVIQYHHHLEFFTGGALGGRIIREYHDAFPGLVRVSVTPFSDDTIQLRMLALSNLFECVDLPILIRETSMGDQCDMTSAVDLNNVIASAIANVTSMVRFDHGKNMLSSWTNVHQHLVSGSLRKFASLSAFPLESYRKMAKLNDKFTESTSVSRQWSHVAPGIIPSFIHDHVGAYAVSQLFMSNSLAHVTSHLVERSSWCLKSPASDQKTRLFRSIFNYRGYFESYDFPSVSSALNMDPDFVFDPAGVESNFVRETPAVGTNGGVMLATSDDICPLIERDLRSFRKMINLNGFQLIAEREDFLHVREVFEQILAANSS